MAVRGMRLLALLQLVVVIYHVWSMHILWDEATCLKAWQN